MKTRIFAAPAVKELIVPKLDASKKSVVVSVKLYRFTMLIMIINLSIYYPEKNVEKAIFRICHLSKAKKALVCLLYK